MDIEYQAVLGDDKEKIVEKKALSVTETCEATGLGATTVRALISNGDLPSVRIGRRVLVPVRELEDFLAGRMKQQP